MKNKKFIENEYIDKYIEMKDKFNTTANEYNLCKKEIDTLKEDEIRFSNSIAYSKKLEKRFLIIGGICLAISGAAFVFSSGIAAVIGFSGLAITSNGALYSFIYSKQVQGIVKKISNNICVKEEELKQKENEMLSIELDVDKAFDDIRHFYLENSKENDSSLYNSKEMKPLIRKKEM